MYYIDDIKIGTVDQITPIEIKDLADGDHTLKLILMDSTGQQIGDEASIKVSVDKAIANLPDTGFKVNYVNNSSNTSGAELKPSFQIESSIDEAIPYSEFTISSISIKSSNP